MDSKEITKSMESCFFPVVRRNCEKCSFCGKEECERKLIAAAMECITHQQNEINCLKNNLESMKITLRSSAAATRAEGAKDLAYKLKKESFEQGNFDSVSLYQIEKAIEQIEGK